MDTIHNFINNAFVPAASGATLDVLEPATGRTYAKVASSDAADVDAAVRAAKAAFPAWSAMPVTDRSLLLFRLAELITANLERLAQAESRDCGKPLSLARTIDIPRSAINFRYFAGAAIHAPGEMHETTQPAVGAPLRALNWTQRRPRGVAGLIAPWNLPLYLLTWKIAPALATGNTCVAKPSEVTPASATILAELAREAGLPPGVLNIVHGLGPSCGEAIVAHPDIPAISFTGSTGVGRSIGETCGRHLKRVSLELGGKNPFLIFDDADLDDAVATALRAAFTNSGQICLCGSRLLVQRSIYPRVLERIVDGAKALRIGDPADPATAFGSVVSRPHLDKVASMANEAKAAGATIHCGGSIPAPASLPARCRDGFFFPPTVMSGLDPACRVEQEEIFGPVLSVTPFDDEAHALSLANATPYGLASVVFTRDLARAHRVAERIDAGLVWVNCWMVRDLRTPFGGAKASGVGREGGLEALKFFTEPKNICVKW